MCDVISYHVYYHFSHHLVSSEDEFSLVKYWIYFIIYIELDLFYFLFFFSKAAE